MLEVRRPGHQLCPHRRQALIAMALPRIEPIVPTLRAEPFDDPGWLFDVKYDGFRALCFLEQWRGHFVSRNGKPLAGSPPSPTSWRMCLRSTRRCSTAR